MSTEHPRSEPAEVGPSTAEQRLREVAAEIARPHGLLVETVTVRTQGPRTRASIVLDLAGDEPGSADLDTIAEVSREISARLDSDPDLQGLLGNGPSELEVGTPGAERQLREPRHFRRARGRLLEIHDADGRRLHARLLAVTDQDALVLRAEPEPGAKPRRGGTDPTPFELPLEKVAQARAQVEFSRPDEDPAAGADDEQDHQDEEG